MCPDIEEGAPSGGGVGGAAGTYARHAVVPVECLVRVPEIVALEDAAAIALVFITGWEAMVERAGVGTGDLVLIHGGAGGRATCAAGSTARRGRLLGKNNRPRVR